jgi:hypothetical protein
VQSSRRQDEAILAPEWEGEGAPHAAGRLPLPPPLCCSCEPESIHLQEEVQVMHKWHMPLVAGKQSDTQGLQHEMRVCGAASPKWGGLFLAVTKLQTTRYMY